MCGNTASGLPDSARSVTYADQTITFINNCNFQVAIYWINYSGALHHSGQLWPGGSTGFSTWVGHAWLAADGSGDVATINGMCWWTGDVTIGNIC